MNPPPALPARSRRPPYMMAMVLGTALSTLGAPPHRAAAEDRGAAATTQAVSAISRYCTACWRNARLNPDSWNDCTQEVLCRLLERVSLAGWDRALAVESAERQELVRAIDTIKKRVQRSRKSSPAMIEELADRKDLPGRRRAEDRQAVEQVANELLSARQQQILRRSFEGGSVQEIADELGVAPERVSDQKYKAIQKLREHFI